METLSQLQIVNDYLIRDCQEKDKFIEACSIALHHCQCGVVSQRLIEDLAYIENKINTEEYKGLLSKHLDCQDYQLETSQLDTDDTSLEPKTTVLPTEELQYEVLENQAPAQENIIITDLQQHREYEGDYTTLDVSGSGNITVHREGEAVIRTITLPPYPGTPVTSTSDVTSTVVDTSECVIDASGGEIEKALESLNAVAIVAGDSGPVVVYEQLNDDGQMIVVTSERSVSLSEQANEITVLAETASLQPPISDGVIESEDVVIEDKKDINTFATKEEEKELLQKITLPLHVKDAENDDKVFRCFICEKGYSKQQSLKDHMITHDKARREKFKCTVCGKGFPKPYMVKSHMETHNRLKPFQCNLCGKKFAQKSCQTRHMKIHNKEKPYSCSICDKRFNQFGHAKKHMAMHSEVRHKCHLCPRTFPSINKLGNHLALHEKLAKKKSVEPADDKPVYFKQLTKKDSLRKYSCKYCPSRFASKPDLEIHDETHAVERPHRCDICGLRCIKEKNLKFHKKSHSKNASSICEICGRSFRSRYWLANHLLQHNGVKPFMCEDCGEVFTVQSNLTRHRVRYHNDQPNRKCQTCDQIFSSFKELKHHRTKFHRNDRQLYRCKKCGEKFSTVSALVKHHRGHLEVPQVEAEEEESPAENDSQNSSPEKRPTRSSSRITNSKWKRRATEADDESLSVEATDETTQSESQKDPPLDSSIVSLDDTILDKRGKVKKPCPLCGKLLHPSSIYKHIQFHDESRSSNTPFTKTGQRRKPCPVCNMFISETTVYTHMRIHKKRGDIPDDPPTKVDDGKFREACDVCGKMCTPQSLPKHKVLHLPVRPFSCDICGKRFNQKSHVSRHKKSQHPSTR